MSNPEPLMRLFISVFAMEQGTKLLPKQKLVKTQEISGGCNAGILITRIPMTSEASAFPLPFKQTQFPVPGAYNLTINRKQG